MGTHCFILTIGNLVSPFPLRRTSEGADWPAPSERKISPVLADRKNLAVKPWDPLSRSWHSRDKMFTHRRDVN